MSWLADGSANRYTKTYMIDYLDLSGNLIIRNGAIKSGANEIQFDNFYNFINIPLNAHIFGELKLDYSGTEYNVGYQCSQVASFSGALDSVTTDISNIKIQTTNISYSSPTTTISNTTSCDVLNFTGTLNSITPTEFGYLSGATSNLQTQITNINAVTTTAQNNFTATQRFSNNLRLDGGLIVQSNNLTLSNVNLQKIQYLSTVSSNIQTQLDSVKTKTTNLAYTSIDNTTAISGNVVFYDDVTFDTAINNISNSTFNYLDGVNDFIQDQFDAITQKITNVSYLTGTTTIGGTTSTTNLLFSGTLNTIPSATFGYLANVTSDIQAQISAINTISLSAENTFTGNNQFKKQFYIIAQNTVQLATNELVTDWNSGSAGDSCFEMALGKSQRGLTIQGGQASDGNSCFGLYFLNGAFSLSGTKKPIMFAKDNATTANSTLEISTGSVKLSNLNITGNMLTNNGATTITNDTLNRLQYLTTLSSNVQSQIDTIATKLTDVLYSSATTTIANALVFTGTLNTISTTAFGYLSGLTQNIQTALTDLINRTSFTYTGTSGQVLVSNGTSNPTWTSTPTINVATATVASNLSNSSVGAIPYTSGTNTTSFLTASNFGKVLVSQGSSTGPMYAGGIICGVSPSISWTGQTAYLNASHLNKVIVFSGLTNYLSVILPTTDLYDCVSCTIVNKSTNANGRIYIYKDDDSASNRIQNIEAAPFSTLSSYATGRTCYYMSDANMWFAT